jgi:hypothetical protein
LSGVARIHLAFAVARTCDECARGFLAQNISIGLTPTLGRFFHHLRKTARHGAEEAVTIINQLIRGEALRRALLRHRLCCAKSESRKCSSAQQKFTTGFLDLFHNASSHRPTVESRTSVPLGRGKIRAKC